MGTGGLSLTEGSNPYLESGDADTSNMALSLGVIVGDATGGVVAGVNVYNTTDNSDRLRIIHNGTESGGGMAGATATWINVTTGHTVADLVALPGTVVLSYNVDGPAGLMSATDVDVYIQGAGDNVTDTDVDEITINETGNLYKGVFDLDDGSQFIRNPDLGASVGFTKNAGTSFMTCLLYTSPSPRDRTRSRMPSSA